MQRHLSSVLRSADWPYGEVFRDYEPEVSSKCASGQREILRSRTLDVVPREAESRELPREVASIHSSIVSQSQRGFRGSSYHQPDIPVAILRVLLVCGVQASW
jgi:hypothetical protein